VLLIGSTVVMDAGCSVIALITERDATKSDIHSYGQALFWTTTQLLTVSSQMRNPVTGPGMWLAWRWSSRITWSRRWRGRLAGQLPVPPEPERNPPSRLPT